MTTALNLTPEVPNRVELPAWLDAAGLAYPESLEAIRAEAANLEVAFIDAARQVIRLLRGFAVVVNATYVATNPAASDNDAPKLPGDVIDAVSAATGAARLEELEGWLTGLVGDGACPVSSREEVLERIGWLVDWDQELRDAKDALATRGVAVSV